ncbi:MAG TPA: hypothetical protein VNN62_09080 [Methylomirabilota bacterium]|nr:hypothetical protein [Methylomirabilota bacterium]
MTDWFNIRAGAVLAPLGRFHPRHNNNLWNLPRRSLVDRGVSVLPSQAAWDELGFGFVGKAPGGQEGALDYQFSVVNGVGLDAELEGLLWLLTPADAASFSSYEEEAAAFVL